MMEPKDAENAVVSALSNGYEKGNPKAASKWLERLGITD
jgi:hypothetical protein